LLTIPVSTVLCSSGKLRFGKYLRNEVSMGWIYTWCRYVNWQRMCKTFISYITVTVRAPDLAANMFGIGTHVFHYHLIAVIQVPASYPAPSFFFYLSTLHQHTNHKLSRNRQ
jgi:hypothetical protein